MNEKRKEKWNKIKERREGNKDETRGAETNRLRLKIEDQKKQKQENQKEEEENSGIKRKV